MINKNRRRSYQNHAVYPMKPVENANWFAVHYIHRSQEPIHPPKKWQHLQKDGSWEFLSSFPIVVVGLRHLAFNDSLSNSVSVRKSVPIRVQRFMHLSHMYDNVLVPSVYQFIHQKNSNYSVIFKWWCVSHFLHDLRSIGPSHVLEHVFRSGHCIIVVPTEAIRL